MPEPLSPPNLELLPEHKPEKKEMEAMSPALVAAITVILRRRNCCCHLTYETGYMLEWKTKAE